MNTGQHVIRTTCDIIRAPKRIISSALLSALSLVVGCGEAVYDTIELMPPPAVYAAGEVNPFPRVTTDNFAAQSKLFYVTDRRAAGPDDKATVYANQRGFVLRGGAVQVQADPPFSGWEEVRAISLSEEESPKRLLRLREVDEYGPLPVNEISFLPAPPDADQARRAGERFASEIDAKLSGSVQKDIFIYVHGYNVDFDYSILSSKELQHYLGYRGAFITYAWPATPNRLLQKRCPTRTVSPPRPLRCRRSQARSRQRHMIC